MIIPATVIGSLTSPPTVFDVLKILLVDIDKFRLSRKSLTLLNDPGTLIAPNGRPTLSAFFLGSRVLLSVDNIIVCGISRLSDSFYMV